MFKKKSLGVEKKGKRLGRPSLFSCYESTYSSAVALKSTRADQLSSPPK